MEKISLILSVIFVMAGCNPVKAGCDLLESTYDCAITKPKQKVDCSWLSPEARAQSSMCGGSGES